MIDSTTMTDSTTRLSPHPPAAGRWFLDTWMRVVSDGSDTGGAMSVLEWRGGAGFSPPLHVHHQEDTAMIVLAGRLTGRVGGVDRVVEQGDLVWLPRDVPHSFRVDSDEAHYLEIITPARFVGFHVEGSRPVDGHQYLPEPRPVDVAELVAAAAAYDCDIIGPPMVPE